MSKFHIKFGHSLDFSIWSSFFRNIYWTIVKMSRYLYSISLSLEYYNPDFVKT